jgi:RNA polymerase sigma-70 factor, ECF subfamily
LRATRPGVDLVYSLARRLAAEPHDAEDLVQETYLRAWRAWRSGTRPRRVEPSLATICLNITRDRARWAARHRERPTSDLDLHPHGSGNTAEAAVDRVQIEAALAKLPEPQRIAVVLADVCGFTAREIAKVTDCPLGTALARIHRGRRKLAELVETLVTTIDGDRVLGYRYTDDQGTTVLVVQREGRFEPPADAEPATDADWTTRVDGVTVLCTLPPDPYLIVGTNTTAIQQVATALTEPIA